MRHIIPLTIIAILIGVYLITFQPRVIVNSHKEIVKDTKHYSTLVANNINHYTDIYTDEDDYTCTQNVNIPQNTEVDIVILKGSIVPLRYKEIRNNELDLKCDLLDD